MRAAYFGLVFGVGAGAVLAADAPVEAILAAERAGAPLPYVAELAPELDLAGAYRMQARYLLERLRGVPPGGYKAGLTTPLMQQRFGTREPIAAVLYREGATEDGVAIDLARYPGMLVEVELGYVLDRALTEPLAKDADVLGAIRAIVPVIELPRVRYADLARVRGLDLVVTNTGAETYVIGAPLPARARADLNALPMTLTHDGQVVAQGTGAAALGDQREALRWLINKVLELGFTLEPGQLLITGALAPPLPARPGIYRARFGDDATLEFIGL